MTLISRSLLHRVCLMVAALGLVVAGWSNKDIGQRLYIVRKTVEVHRSGLMHKMGATNLPDLVRLSVLLEGMPEAPPVPGPESEDSAEDTQPPPD